MTLGALRFLPPSEESFFKPQRARRGWGGLEVFCVVFGTLWFVADFVEWTGVKNIIGRAWELVRNDYLCIGENISRFYIL